MSQHLQSGQQQLSPQSIQQLFGKDGLLQAQFVAGSDQIAVTANARIWAAFASLCGMTLQISGGHVEAQPAQQPTRQASARKPTRKQRQAAAAAGSGETTSAMASGDAGPGAAPDAGGIPTHIASAANSERRQRRGRPPRIAPAAA